VKLGYGQALPDFLDAFSSEDHAVTYELFIHRWAHVRIGYSRLHL